MSSKLEPVIWLRDTGHIGIHGGADRKDVHNAKIKIVNCKLCIFLHIKKRHVS